MAVRSCTCLVDLHDAAIGDLLQKPQQAGLVVPQARVLIARPDVVDADGPSRQRRARQPLPEVAGASEAQRHAPRMRLRPWLDRAAALVKLSPLELLEGDRRALLLLNAHRSAAWVTVRVCSTAERSLRTSPKMGQGVRITAACRVHANCSGARELAANLPVLGGGVRVFGMPPHDFGQAEFKLSLRPNAAAPLSHTVPFCW